MVSARGTAVVVGIVALAAAACSLFLSTDELSDPPASSDAAADVDDVVGPNRDASANDAAADASTDAPSDAGGFNLGCNANGLVAAWMFDEGQGTTAADCTGHGHEAQLKSDAGWIAGHDGGMALFLQPNAYGEVQNPSPIGQPGPFTITAWLVVRAAPDNGRIFAISAPGVDPGFELAHEKGPRASDGRTSYLSLVTFRALLDGGVDVASVDSQSISLNSWVHVAVTHDGNNAAIFVDGDLHDQKALGARRISTQPAFIGRRSSTGCCFFDGYVDELRYYDRVLPDGEIRALAGR